MVINWVGSDPVRLAHPFLFIFIFFMVFFVILMNVLFSPSVIHGLVVKVSPVSHEVLSSICWCWQILNSPFYFIFYI